MTVAGQIRTMPPHDLLQWVELNQKSGVLELRKRSAFCAVAARTIAKSKAIDADLAFLCGLLMDFGKIVLLAVIEETIEENPEYRDLPPRSVPPPRGEHRR